ncbi:MAG: hypothetical protein KAW12_07200 [Candidatus Aminicenantes bacterium]|nr:hypothetical protein [Candidatus Aminicenantes bacterium]
MINNRFLPSKFPKLTPIQLKYFNDWDHRFQVISAGRRSGKSMIGKRKGLIFSLQHQHVRGFYAAPTHLQAKAIFWKQLKDETKYLRHRISESELSIELRNGSFIQVVGLDKPERVEGQPWDWAHLTEFPNMKSNVWIEHLRPAFSEVSEVTGKPGWVIFDGTPEGLNHYYNLALMATDGVIPEPVPIEGAFASSEQNPEWALYTWLSSDILPGYEIANAESELDQVTFYQEYGGKFLGRKGRAYYAFGDDNIRNIRYNPEEEIHCGIDFNVNPMTCTIGHIRGNEYQQFGELYLPNSNTPALCKEIARKFSEKKTILINIRVYIFTLMQPEPTGIRHQTTRTWRYCGNSALRCTARPRIPLSRIESTQPTAASAQPMESGNISLTRHVKKLSEICSLYSVLTMAILTNQARRTLWGLLILVTLSGTCSVICSRSKRPEDHMSGLVRRV